MAAYPRTNKHPRPDCRLLPFKRQWADHVITWVTSPQEAYWLAPQTPPPLTGDTLLRWQNPDRNAFLLHQGGTPEPVAYGELNTMGNRQRQYWLGHLIVDPTRRRRGLGIRLTTLLLREAFEQRGAHRVTLVVFRENEPALRCYRLAGMTDDGLETHSFPAYGREECLIRLVATRSIT